MNVWVPTGSASTDAAEVWETIARVHAAQESMRANYWLRRAMVHHKDLMLWDGSAAYDEFRRVQRDRRAGTGADHAAIRRFHARLVAQGDHDPTSQTAAQFELSTRQVRSIVNSDKAERN
jgi:hypothetical protein